MFEILLSLAVVCSTAFTTFLLMLPSRYVKHTAHNGQAEEPKVSVQVLVLGDIGRSPRMQYHAMSIAKHGGRVDVIGYKESALHPGLVDNALINIVPIPPPPAILRTSRVPFIVTGPLKVLWQIWSLWLVLGYRTKPSRWLLVQNPPSIPTLFISMIICFLRNTHLIIDWHNYGWTILAGTKGPSHPFVAISKAYEATLGQWAPTASFTVTHAMSKQLRGQPYNLRSPIFTLHDRPAETFQPISSPKAREEFLRRLPETKDFADAILSQSTRLIVSSTSWTPDEDFNILLEALIQYSADVLGRKDKGDLPPILAIITGKGPQKEMYLKRIEQLTAEQKLSNITIRTAWLSTEDYATLLASADLGVCLHMSSSGVDLPMKVVDMFGAGLPVAGYAGYESWPELVTEGVNGRGFETAEQLAVVLEGLFKPSNPELASLRRGAVKEGEKRWDDEWDSVAGRLLGVCE